MSFFKKRKPSRSNSAPAQQQQFPTKSPSPSQQKQQSRPIYPWSAHTPSFTQSLSPFPRHAHALSTTATVAGELFLFGGYVQSSKSVTNDLHMFSTRDFSITPMKTSGQAPNPRYGHRAAFTNTTLFIIWGGVTNRSDRNAENRCDDNSLYLLNLVSRQWTHVVVNGPGPDGRSHHIVTLVDSKLFVFGGRTAGRFFNDIWVFDLNRLTSNPVWETYEPTPGNEKPLPRSGHVSVTTSDRIIIFGGLGSEGFFNDTWSFNISKREWTEVQCTGSIPSPREDHAAVLVDNVMYVFGGRASDGTDLGDLTALNLSTQQWIAFNDIGPSPSRRRAHAMATDGTRILLLGGTLSRDSKANESELIYVLDTKRITYLDPDPNAVNPSEKTTQLARNSSAGLSIQGQLQRLTFASTDSGIYSEDGASSLDHPDSLQITRDESPDPNDLPSIPPVMNDKLSHVPEEDDDSEGSTEHHAKLVTSDASSGKEVALLEHERIANLERQLSETLAAQAERDRRIARLIEQLTQNSALLEQAEANVAKAKKRTGLELRGLQAKLDESMLSRDEHLRTALEAQSALQKATSRAAEANERSQRELAEVHAKLEARESELAVMRLRFADAEDGWAKSKAEADMRACTHAAADTLRGGSQSGARLVNIDVDRVTSRLVRAVEAEMASLRGSGKGKEEMECRNEPEEMEYRNEPEEMEYRNEPER